MYKDFCQAYELAPMAEQLEPQLQGMFGAQSLQAGTVKQLTSGRPIAPAYICSSAAIQTKVDSRAADRRAASGPTRDIEATGHVTNESKPETEW
jgi:hypothetical protein